MGVVEDTGPLELTVFYQKMILERSFISDTGKDCIYIVQVSQETALQVHVIILLRRRA